MEEEYIRKSFIVPNAAINVACFKAGMTEEDYYNTLGGRMYGDNKEKTKSIKGNCAGRYSDRHRKKRKKISTDGKKTVQKL